MQLTRRREVAASHDEVAAPHDEVAAPRDEVAASGAGSPSSAQPQS